LRSSTFSSDGAREQIACLLRDGSSQGQSVEHLPQFPDDPPLRIGRLLDISAGVLDNAQQRLQLGLQLRVFPQSFFSKLVLEIEDFSISEKRSARGCSSWDRVTHVDLSDSEAIVHAL